MENSIRDPTARPPVTAGWWDGYGSVLKAGFEPYVGLEDAAISIRNLQTTTVPGLLQTEAYARELLRAGYPAVSAEVVALRLAARLTRQQRLFGRNAPLLHAVLDEAVLLRNVGGRAVMYEQLKALVAAAGLPSVTLQVLRLADGPHVGLDGSMVILRLSEADGDQVALVEHILGCMYVERASDIGRLADTFRHLTLRAQTPEDSVEYISALAERSWISA